MVLSAVMLFFGGVGIRDKSVREAMSVGVDTMVEKIDMDDDKIAQTEAGMAMMGVEMDVRSLIDQAKRVLKIARDGRLSASELAFTGTTAIKLINELKGNQILSLLSEKDLDELIDQLDDVSMRMYIFVAFFWVTIICCAAVIVLHVLNFKLPGVSVVVLNLIWLIMFIVVKSKLNEMVVNELEGPEDYLTVTAAPAIGFTAAVLALVLWILKDIIAQRLGNGSEVLYAAGAAEAYEGAPAGRVKSVMPLDMQGAENSMGDATAKAIPYPEFSAPEDAYETEAAEAQEREETEEDMVRSLNYGEFVYSGKGVDYKMEDIKFCPKCGADVDPDYDFCGSCGFKIFSR